MHCLWQNAFRVLALEAQRSHGKFKLLPINGTATICVKELKDVLDLIHLRISKWDLVVFCLCRQWTWCWWGPAIRVQVEAVGEVSCYKGPIEDNLWYTISKLSIALQTREAYFHFYTDVIYRWFYLTISLHIQVIVSLLATQKKAGKLICWGDRYTTKSKCQHQCRVP